MATNMIPLCKKILELAEQNYGNLAEPPTFAVEHLDQLALDFYSTISEATLENNFPASYDSFEFDEDHDHGLDGESSIENDEEHNETTCSENNSQDWEFVEINNHTYSYDIIKSVVDFYNKCKKNRFFQTQKRYSFVRDYKTIQRFKTYLESNGNRAHKLQLVDEYTFERFQSARESFLCISERDLMYWALTKAKEMSFDFKASHQWLQAFKRKHRIVSRKITKYISMKDVQDKPNILARGRQFVDGVKLQCMGIPSGCIWNFDQGGFNYELMYNRTLSCKGEKETLLVQKSRNASTHSYSIMPLISMDGRLSEKLLVCLQEIGGKLGPRVKASLHVPENIYLSCSKSGKLDKIIMENWIENCVAPLAQTAESFVLLYDSWAGQIDPKLYEKVPNLTHRFQIPPKTTSIAQPLDLYFFRQYKLLRRKIADRIMLESLSIDLHSRDSVLKLHSLVYNQFQAPCFQPMLKYSWYACKYTDTRAGRFLNVNEKLFGFQCAECGRESCDMMAFIVWGSVLVRTTRHHAEMKCRFN